MLSGLATRRGELVSTGEGHLDFPLGFNDWLMASETSSTCHAGQQEDIRRGSSRRGFICIGIEFYI